MSNIPAPFSAANGARRAVDDAITSRRSIRAFLPAEVPEATLRDLLEVAARAPSGTNTQPWRVHVLTGNALTRLSERVTAVHDDTVERERHAEEYPYYPANWVSPYIDRRRKVGWDLYRRLGIGREDKAGMHAQVARNYRFFDAPVGLVFTISRVLAQGSWLDYGMFIQNVMIAARARGLDTCAQAAFNRFHRVVAVELEMPDSDMLVCCMALGIADPSAIVNGLTTTRAAVDDFATFRSQDFGM